MPPIHTRNAVIHYSRTGSGPAVLLLQGVRVIGNGWAPQVEGLKQRFTLITIDNRGIGGSTFGGSLTVEDMADDALAVADAEQIGRFHLVGHSMGGLIAQQVALTATRRVTTITLVCTFLRGKQGTIGRALAAAIPGARYVEFPDAGHALPIQQPAEVNALIEEHVSSTRW